MSNKKNIFGMFVIVLFSIMSSCNLNANEFSEYKIAAKYETESNSPYYKKAGLNCKFYNSFDKTVKNLIVVFTLFDSEGIPVSKLKYSVDGNIAPNEVASFCLNLDEIINSKDVEIKSADFVYVSKIIFEDNTQWSDPMGFNYFLK